MRFLIDQNLPPKLAWWISQKGHETVPARDLGLRSANDSAIVRAAIKGDFAIVTKDADFQNLVGARVVWIRIGNTTVLDLLNCLERSWPVIEAALEDGEMLVEVFDDR